MAQEGVLNALIQCHWGAGGIGAHIALLNYISNYVPQMGMPQSPWDDLYFTSKGKGTRGSAGCANCPTASLNQIGATLKTPTAEAINVGLAGDPSVDILGLLSAGDASINVSCTRKTIYLLAPYVGMFLEVAMRGNL